MRYVYFFAVYFFSLTVQADEEINTTDVTKFLGESVVACGVLKEVVTFSKGLYLNMDAKYPKQSVTFVLWRDDINEFVKRLGVPESNVGKDICAKGLAAEYKGRNQIVLYNSYSVFFK